MTRVNIKVPGIGEFVTRPHLCDETVIEEVIEQDGYGVRDLPLVGQVVLDLGAHIGVFAVMCAAKGARVYSVEPQPENLELLRLNTAPWPTIKIVPVAMASEVGEVRISGESGGARTLPWEGHDDGVMVQATTLGILVKQLGIERKVSIMKLDMEGAEADVITTAHPKLLRSIHRIVMETHGPQICPWVTRPRVGEIVEKLAPSHNLEVSGHPAQCGKILAVRNGA